MFEQAHGMLKAAERIYFLGFGFHPDNMRRFRFFDPDHTAGKVIKATSRGYDGLELQRLEALLKSMGAQGQTLHNGVDCLSFFSYLAPLE